MARRRRLSWFLLVAFVVVPIAELYVLIQVGQVIGAWWTIVLLVADSILGSWLVRREGGRAWQALRTALETGRMPATELADAALLLVGGVLMLSPGFVTDLAGILLILPLTRPLFRRVLAGVVARRLTVLGPLGQTGGARGGPGQTDRPGPVVRGEVVEE
ncbi:FxsA family protein [Nocardioides dongxiaopingii]|uniref:FxsA family protein n=1 Tax=Nocardioides dongxiaopingii TaxID=2576036 RepID=UPI0010C76C10|nr:FxsA family protein [Nocardioides dongxiaopingii]